MLASFVPRLAACLTIAAVAACGNTAELLVSAGIGPNPKLPPPDESLLPIVNIAPAKPRPNGAKPVAAQVTMPANVVPGMQRATGFGSVHDVPQLPTGFTDVFESWYMEANGIRLHAGGPAAASVGWLAAEPFSPSSPSTRPDPTPDRSSCHLNWNEEDG